MAPINLAFLMVPYQTIDAAMPLDVLSSCEPVELTAGFKVVPTTTIKDCPPLDYLLVGGPIPTYQLSESFKSFIRAHVEAGKGLFTICTGAITVAQTGILDGNIRIHNKSTKSLINILLNKGYLDD
ncbi:uncharacterized protein EAF02_011766 [Botrytis sinoallii]|uniref:uncharacterized protein n=1 Tax=Botrytis sinoallii TaxID=1463999 RepID=UPI0019009C3B|nr:uncharacterized protein EAF02_011766 [Botrytis sinoallii]KAF7854148.1 hypothetical protein EAF02_011766 [Botrytis sinoallii]